MALIRARQRPLTAVSPHQANRRYIVPSRRLPPSWTFPSPPILVAGLGTDTVTITVDPTLTIPDDSQQLRVELVILDVAGVEDPSVPQEQAVAGPLDADQAAILIATLFPRAFSTYTVSAAVSANVVTLTEATGAIIDNVILILTYEDAPAPAPTPPPEAPPASPWTLHADAEAWLDQFTARTGIGTPLDWNSSATLAQKHAAALQLWEDWLS